MPERIQRRRTAGWRTPVGAVYVGRPSRWGNPFPVGEPGPFSAEDAVRMFRDVVVTGEAWLITGEGTKHESRHRFTRQLGKPPVPTVEEVRAELGGRDLACWCPVGQACHADVLLELANPDLIPAAKVELPARLVILESPYAGDVERNVDYARAAMRDCLLRGEAPYASHLLYTQPGVLADADPGERRLGIEAGLLWGRAAHATVVYVDHGYTSGMRQGIQRAEAEGRPVEVRTLLGHSATATAARP